MPRDPSEFVEHHAVHVLGYNDALQRIRFWNNWGPAWGENSTGYLPYEYFERYTTDAWLPYYGNPRILRPRRTDNRPSIQRLLMFNNTIGNPSALIDLWSWEGDLRVGWCVMTYRDGYLDIEDFFLRPEFHGSGHQSRLTRAVLDFSAQQELPLRLWIAHADTERRAGNFQTINDFWRTAGFKRFRSDPHPWAAYVAW